MSHSKLLRNFHHVLKNDDSTEPRKIKVGENLASVTEETLPNLTPQIEKYCLEKPGGI